MSEPMPNKHRQYLKGLAHPMKPILAVGKLGLTEALKAEIELALEKHELIKIRIPMDESSERKNCAEEISQFGKAGLIQLIGKTGTFFRQREKDSAIKLPKIS